jgi:uncharacterized protein (DUF433 family)
MPPARCLDPTGRDEPLPAIWCDPDRHSRDACLGGTRVPVSALFHFLAEGADIDAWLEAYPTVGRGQVLAVLEPAVFHLVQEDEFTRAAPPRVDTTKLRRSVAAMLLCDGKTSAVLRRHVHRRDEAFGELG